LRGEERELRWKATEKKKRGDPASPKRKKRKEFKQRFWRQDCGRKKEKKATSAEGGKKKKTKPRK